MSIVGTSFEWITYRVVSDKIYVMFLSLSLFQARTHISTDTPVFFVYLDSLHLRTLSSIAESFTHAFVDFS